MTAVEQENAPRLPPRWFVRAAWAAHRGIYKVSMGRVGTWAVKEGRPGMLRLRTTGRRTGQERAVMLGYVEDGENLILVAMNGGADPDPGWWLNLQANPDAGVDLQEGPVRMKARAASKEERPRLLSLLAAASPNGDYRKYAALRSRETTLVILEPSRNGKGSSRR